MKVLAMMEDYPTFSGGRMAFIRLLKIIEKDIELTFISTTGATQKANVLLNREIRYFVPARGKILYYLRFLFKLLIHGLTIPFDIVFCNAGLAAFVGVVLAKIRRRKIIVLAHDCFTFSSMMHLVKGPIKKLSGIIRVFDRIVPLFFVDLILAVSPTIKKDLKKYYGLSKVIFLGNVIQL